MGQARTRNATIERLPRTTRRLINLIGWDDTYQLLAACGGGPLYVHVDPDHPNSPLRKLLSADAAETLCLSYGGTVLRLPKPDRMEIVLRDREIAEQSGNLPTAHLARDHNLSKRHVRRIKST